MDEKAFTARIEQQKTPLYRMALLYLGSESLALDIVDEAIFKGFKAFRQLRREEHFNTWMTRILINECKRALRRRKREFPMDTLPETAAEAFDALPLRDAIRRLPKDLKAVIILRYFSGFTLSQTAKALRIPQGTAATRQRRALTLLNLDLTQEE